MLVLLGQMLLFLLGLLEQVAKLSNIPLEDDYLLQAAVTARIIFRILFHQQLDSSFKLSYPFGDAGVDSVLVSDGQSLQHMVFL
jgi:hypothetical protein